MSAFDLPTIEGNPRNTAIPHRRYRLVLDLEADTLDDLFRELHIIANDGEREGLPSQCTSGGFNAGYELRLGDQGDHVTHDSFIDSLSEWMESRRAAAKS